MYRQKLPNPVHIKSYQLAYICSLLKDPNYEITLAPKADGINSLFSYKSKYIFEAEDMGSYKLVFDSANYKAKHNDTLFARSQWIRSLHPINYTNKDIASSVDEIKNLIECDNIQLSKSIASKIGWFPKTTILIKNLSAIDFLKILDDKPMTNYDNDGWIVTVYYKNRGQIKLLLNSPLKVKPQYEMTIDLFYNDSTFTTLDNTLVDVDFLDGIINSIGIWRCRYECKEKKWKAIFNRNDKNKPNCDYIVKNIIKYHQNPWIPSDIEKYINCNNIYYPNNFGKIKISSGCDNFLNHRRAYIQFILHKVISIGSTILDIGCGNGSTLECINLIKYNKYVGIDKDYMCLSKCIKKMRRSDYLIWGDITRQRWNYFEDDLDNKFDVIICINVVHYIDNNIKVKSFFENISRLSKRGSHLLLIALDPNKMKSCHLASPDNDFLVKQIEGNKFLFRYPWINKEFSEIIPSLEILMDEIKKEWIETNLPENTIVLNSDNIYNTYDSFHTIKLFIKKD